LSLCSSLHSVLSFSTPVSPLSLPSLMTYLHTRNHAFKYTVEHVTRTWDL
jgi:hypothetical protein